MDDTDSVSSQASRRSARLAKKKRKAEDEDEEQEAISISSDNDNTPRPRSKKKRRSSSKTPGTAQQSSRRSTTDLESIPENISTTTTNDFNDYKATTVETPQVIKKAGTTRPLPAISPSQLQLAAPSTPAAASQSSGVIAPQSSKKLMALEGKAETPFKKLQVMDEQEQQKEVEELPLPKEDTTQPLVEEREVVLETYSQFFRNRSHMLLCRHGHYLKTMRFWVLFFLVLQIVLYPIVIPRILSGTVRMANIYSNFYKSFLPKPVDRTPYLAELEEQLQAAHELEKQTIRANKHLVAEIQGVVQEHVEKSKTETQTFAAAQKASVLNITIPRLWDIIRDCSNGNDDDRVSVARATDMIREAYVAKRNKLKEESDADGWIRQHLPNKLVDRNEQRLQRLITERIEMDRADFDYTDTILASTGNFVNELPWGNRLLALWGLRFYGNGPEAAIVPTTPRSAVGHCWALIPPATATIKLTNLIYVQSISIEHPSQGQNNSAIRKFSLEGIDSQLRSWPLGSFVYDNQERRQDYMVRDEYNGEEIPPVLVVKLIVDSIWGDDYACLYRFRVFGEKEVGGD